jgi:hypothetical protein
MSPMAAGTTPNNIFHGSLKKNELILMAREILSKHRGSNEILHTPSNNTALRIDETEVN